MADWVSGLGGVLAVIAAVVAWRVSEKLLAVEQGRDRHASLAASRAQAELVFAIGAKLPQREPGEQWALYLVNASTKPVYDVCVRSQKVDGSGPNPSLKLGALPPGKFVVPTHPKYLWGALIDYERITEPVEFVVRGKGNQMVQSLEFRDAKRRSWTLPNGTEMTPASAAGDVQSPR